VQEGGIYSTTPTTTHHPLPTHLRIYASTFQTHSPHLPHHAYPLPPRPGVHFPQASTRLRSARIRGAAWRGVVWRGVAEHRHRYRYRYTQIHGDGGYKIGIGKSGRGCRRGCVDVDADVDVEAVRRKGGTVKVVVVVCVFGCRWCEMR
jgi:hypothetical protein